MEKQKTFSKSKKIMVLCFSIVFALMCAGGGLVHWLNNERSSINATQNTDSTSFVSVDEIWNAEEGYFNANTLNSLLQYITGNEDITASDVASTKINQTRTSADIRTSTANGKTTSQDVQVTFGRLTWTVTYLSQDANGNDIVTLWLSNSYQEVWEGRPKNEGEHYGFIDGALYSDWSNNFQNSSFTVTYPSCLYGASYIHAVTLNNGGTYATSTSAVTSQPAQQDSNSVFAIYTMDSVAGSVTKYLVTPSEVAYQETENVNTQYGWSSYYPNEAYGEPNGSGSWNTSNGGAVNITTNQYYDAWADDTLWLPSLTETGYNTGYEGLWDTSTSQRASNTGSYSNMGTVGTASGTAYNYSWLRSGTSINANNACGLNASGAGNFVSNVDGSYAVRPALHLNLNSAARNAQYPPTVWDGTSTEQPTLQDPAQANSEDNPYIIDSAAKLAWISANFDQPNCYGQHYLQTVNIDLASHPWTPINNASSQRAYFYDGGNHTVSNLYINTAEQTLTSNNYIGLFGYVYGSSSNHCYVKNLGIVNGSIAGEGSYVGAVVGYAGYTDITNCYNEKTDITMTGSSNHVGGVAGYNYSGTISGSYNTGTVSGSSEVGGVAGNNNRGTISGSYNTGSVSGVEQVGGVAGRNYSRTISSSYNTGTVSGENDVGGVVGLNFGTISSSYNDGDITGSSENVGGVAGYNQSGTISGSYNDGDITGTSYYVGGVAGYNNNGTISGSYNTRAVSGGSEVGGVAGRNYYGTISDSYNTGTVSGSNYVGGVVGLNYETISSSYNTGTVSGERCVGGVSGYNSEGTISSSYNTGAVSGSNNVGGVAGYNARGTISSSYNTGAVSGSSYVGGVAGYVTGSSSSPAVISSCFSTGAVTRTSGSSTYFGGVVGRIYNSTSVPSQYVSISWCYYNSDTVGSVVTKAIGRGTGYQCYGLTTAQMQGTQNENWMYLSNSYWNFASGQYPTLKYVAEAETSSGGNWSVGTGSVA